MKKKVNIFSNPYDITKSVKELVEKELIKNDYIINENNNDDADYNLVIGGDGTFIKAVHDSKFSTTPFIGINTGHLGFYNDIEKDNYKKAIQKLAKKDYIINNLRFLECKVGTDDGVYEFKSINEIVLKAKYASVLHFNLYVDDVLLQSFAGDGIIFSTPSGSTAYNLSAGGSIMYQNMDAFQLTPLAAIRSTLHRSLDKSLVVPKETKIKIITRKRETSESTLTIDGFYQRFSNINFLEISLAESTINKLVFDKNWFWKNIKYKFI